MTMTSKAPKEEEGEAEIARVVTYLRRLQSERFYGKITINLQGGRLVDVRTEQVLKVTDLR